MFVDYVLNGHAGPQGFGDSGRVLEGVRFDPGLLRPFINHKGQRVAEYATGKMLYNNQTGVYVPERRIELVENLTRQGFQSPAFAANAQTLTKEAWLELDRAVIRANRQRLSAWADLESRNSRSVPGMSKMTLEYQSMNDVGEARVDMDARTPGRTDRPLFDLKSIPLPITHSDFTFSSREIAVSRNSGTPLDTTMAEMAGRRVAEMIEKTLIGTETGVTYGTQTAGVGTHTGTSTVFGYTNFTYRVTKTDLHTPTSANPENLVEDLIEMRETMYSNGFFGPFVVYYSTGYDRFFDDDYFRTGGTAVARTTRERLASIDNLVSFKRLDYLTSGYQLVMVQMSPDVVQAINGMEITTVQWESRGGFEQNFKVMAIKVPLFKVPYNGVAGVLHGTTS